MDPSNNWNQSSASPRAAGVGHNNAHHRPGNSPAGPPPCSSQGASAITNNKRALSADCDSNRPMASTSGRGGANDLLDALTNTSYQGNQHAAPTKMPRNKVASAGRGEPFTFSSPKGAASNQQNSGPSNMRNQHHQTGGALRQDNLARNTGPTPTPTQQHQLFSALLSDRIGPKKNKNRARNKNKQNNPGPVTPMTTGPSLNKKKQNNSGPVTPMITGPSLAEMRQEILNLVAPVHPTNGGNSAPVVKRSTNAVNSGGRVNAPVVKNAPIHPITGGNSAHVVNRSTNAVKSGGSAPAAVAGATGSGESFETLVPLTSPLTMMAIRAFGYPFMREIQERTIPLLLRGLNVRGTAATGSGKTFAFIIPAIDRLIKSNFQRSQGLGVLILSPTRELAMQIELVLAKFISFLPASAQFSHCLVMGGTNLNVEAKKINKGVAVMIATPGRLLDHLRNTRGFKFNELTCLIVDEADMILSTGFYPTMRQILPLLPSTRQTMLFSATRGGKVEALVSEALGDKHEEVDVTLNKPRKLNDNVVQEYVVCPLYLRFCLVHKLLNEHRSGKVMVFFNQCKSVKFFAGLLNRLGLPVSMIHGNMGQTKRSSTFMEFMKASSMILLCTDVAARGWDIRAVDFILQVDPPSDMSEFAHRVGRAGRDVGSTGSAMLMLTPEEASYPELLRQAHNVVLKETKIQGTDIPNLLTKVCEVVASSEELSLLAKRCSSIYIKGYKNLRPRECFQPENISKVHLRTLFGLYIMNPADVGMYHASHRLQHMMPGPPIK